MGMVTGREVLSSGGAAAKALAGAGRPKQGRSPTSSQGCPRPLSRAQSHGASRSLGPGNDSCHLPQRAVTGALSLGAHLLA